MDDRTSLRTGIAFAPQGILLGRLAAASNLYIDSRTHIQWPLVLHVREQALVKIQLLLTESTPHLR